MKHTKAPWYIYDAGYGQSDIINTYIQELDGDGWKPDICVMSMDLPPDMRKANAQLIAAAPELLEALKLAEKILLIMKTRYAEYLRGRSYWDEGLGLDLDSAIPKAEIAIAKATQELTK